MPLALKYPSYIPILDMKTFVVFSMLLLSAIAVTIGTTITTTIQIQPAYSQTLYCAKSGTAQQLEVWTCTNVMPPSIP
jgi:hypothetical protein